MGECEPVGSSCSVDQHWHFSLSHIAGTLRKEKREGEGRGGAALYFRVRVPTFSSTVIFFGQATRCLVAQTCFGKRALLCIVDEE